MSENVSADTYTCSNQTACEREGERETERQTETKRETKKETKRKKQIEMNIGGMNETFNTKIP